MLETTNQLNSNGSQLSMEEWLVFFFFLLFNYHFYELLSEPIFFYHFRLRSSFFLPFKLSFEIDQFGAPLNDRICQAPIATNQKHFMYLRFSSQTLKVLKIICFYRVRRYIQITKERSVFKSHVTQQ